jgi:hypothetical protein
MRRARTTDGVGVVLVALALLIWLRAVPGPIDPRFEELVPPGASGDMARVQQVAKQALVVLLLTGGAAAVGAVVTGWRSRWRPVFVAPLLLVLAGLAAAPVVVSVRYTSTLFGTTNATLAGLTLPSAIAAVLVAGVGVALLLAGAPKRPLAVVAGLLGVTAAAVVAEEALLWWHLGTRHIVVPASRFVLVHSLVGFLTAAGLVAFAAGLRRPSGSPAREAAVGATVLWGAVALALQLLAPSTWERSPLPFGSFQHTFDPAAPYALGVVTLLAAPAAALLVARMRAHPDRDVVTMRWRGASAALGLLLFVDVTTPLALVLLLWPDQLRSTQLVLWIVLSGGAAVGFSLAALRRDAGPVIAVVAALLAVSSVGLGPGMSGSVGDVRGLLPTPLVLGMLAPLVVALTVAFRSLAARRDGGEPGPAEPTEPTDPADPADPGDPGDPAQPTEPAVPV